MICVFRRAASRGWRFDRALSWSDRALITSAAVPLAQDAAAKCSFSFDFSHFCSSVMITFLPVCLLSRGSEARSSQSCSGAQWGVTPTPTTDASNYTFLNPLSSPTDTVAQCLQSLVDAQVSALHKPNTYRP